MNWILKISALLLIVLTLSPMTLGAISSCHSSEYSCSQEDTTSEEKQSDEGCCMTFCFCSCCGSSFYFEDQKENLIPLSNRPIDIHTSFSYYPPFTTTVLVDIWQPPKIR